MKSIQTTALILWMVIFIAASFILGQFLVSKGILDITSVITGQRHNDGVKKEEAEDELANDVVINKVGQETVRIGLNVASGYFSEYYKDYINYILNNIDIYSESESIAINNMLASDYVFYAVSRKVDVFKYESNEDNNVISISEAEINSFIDKMFEKEIDESFKKQSKYGYDKTSKKYIMDKIDDSEEYFQELQKIENISANELVLTYSCSKPEGSRELAKEIETIKLTCIYKGGRYIINEIQI